MGTRRVRVWVCGATLALAAAVVALGSDGLPLLGVKGSTQEISAIWREAWSLPPDTCPAFDQIEWAYESLWPSHTILEHLRPAVRDCLTYPEKNRGDGLNLGNVGAKLRFANELASSEALTAAGGRAVA